ncbi:MAG: hypothetical protein MRECE_4c010 [Mycoplasmataceae bacterium CE_OT135]|nr:MAG: hypothetical protein MRECE_4c010 [Mycoplasmataceae bacterium CE_OT135]
MTNINQKIEKYNQNYNLISQNRENKQMLEANQRLYGPEMTATLTAQYEQKIQQWEAENELIIQEVANLLKTTRPDGELSQNQEFIYHLKQHLGGEFNLNQLFLLMNNNDREREREREREQNWKPLITAY